ncbi:hypothetical protein N7470_010433 [Penicillium chermesinum]|nr:hypothetical protein N7470_010433 [Penicillium chermesinum]
MAFGVHLLAKKLAKSKPQVMKILQDHVDELDGVLQRTTEDFLIIELDVRTRIQYLSLPLGNLDVFDEMLEDRTFRLSLVAYNDQIEHAVDRFTLALTDTLKDLRKGKEAISALWLYMIRLADGGCFESDSLKPFYQTMMDNLEGWLVALWKLRRRGTALLKALRQLAVSTNEMQRRVGIASRKDVVSFPSPFSGCQVLTRRSDHSLPWAALNQPNTSFLQGVPLHHGLDQCPPTNHYPGILLYSQEDPCKLPPGHLLSSLATIAQLKLKLRRKQKQYKL